MAEDKNMKQKEENEMVDPYTGEVTPPAEDAGKVEEIVPVDSGERSGDKYLLTEETSMDHLAADEDADAVAEEAAHYMEDEEIEDVFEDRQQLAVGGRKELKEELEEHNSNSPMLSGGDIDADWQSADMSGEEAVGGTSPTPDQDVVDELGQAMGITYKDDEPLHTEEKLRERDRNRWELDPKSPEEVGDEEEIDDEEIDDVDIDDEEIDDEEIDDEEIDDVDIDDFVGIDDVEPDE